MTRGDPQFTIVGPRDRAESPVRINRTFASRMREVPIVSILLLTLIVCGCLFAEQAANHDPRDFYLDHLNEPPSSEFYFGTDALGRDLYSIIWYGGRISLCVGALGAAILAAIGICYGCISGSGPDWADHWMMRAAEMLAGIPALLAILFALSLAGEQNVATIAAAIGATGWLGLARVVRGEVRRIRNSEYALAARCMGAGFFHLARWHYLPNLAPTISFMVVSGIGTCIVLESTLSFLGVGLPVEIVSWGSMLSLANRALMTNAWWVILVPGAFLIVTLLCITNIGDYLHKRADRKCSNL